MQPGGSPSFWARRRVSVEGGAGNDSETGEGLALLSEGDAEVAAGGGEGCVSHEGLDDAAVDAGF